MRKQTPCQKKLRTNKEGCDILKKGGGVLGVCFSSQSGSDSIFMTCTFWELKQCHVAMYVVEVEPPWFNPNDHCRTRRNAWQKSKRRIMSGSSEVIS